MYTNYSEGGPAIQGSEYSINFNGTNGYLDTGDTYQSTIRGSFTLACWANMDNLNSGSFNLFGAQTDGLQDSVALFAYPDQVVRFALEGNSNDVVVETADAAVFDTLGEWKHIAVTVTKNSGGNTDAITYVNGSAVSTTVYGDLTEANHNGYTSDKNIYIGALNNDGTAGQFWRGNIDEPAIWDVALDANAVAAVYNSGVPFDLTGDSGNYDNSGDLVGYWRFNEGNGTTATDEGGSNNATLVGGATYSNDNV